MSPHLFPAWGILDNRTIWDLQLKSQVEGFSVNSTLIFQAKLLLWGPGRIPIAELVSIDWNVQAEPMSLSLGSFCIQHAVLDLFLKYVLNE